MQEGKADRNLGHRHRRGEEGREPAAQANAMAAERMGRRDADDAGDGRGDGADPEQCLRQRRRRAEAAAGHAGGGRMAGARTADAAAVIDGRPSSHPEDRVPAVDPVVLCRVMDDADPA
jgi:hypothetical protein